MHELSLAERLIDLMEQAAIEQSFTCVRALHLEAGSLSGVEPSALRFALESSTTGTLAEGAIIHITAITATALCLDCQMSSVISAVYEPCPQCGSHRLNITGGDRLILKHLEVE